MQKILVAGAGKSSHFLIEYLLEISSKNDWKIIVMDAHLPTIIEKLKNHPNGIAAPIDIHNTNERQKWVQEATMVVSLMPPDLHILLAQDCLKFGKNLITSSYISAEMKAMDSEVKKAGLLFMCEMGLDPGIDHMSANKIIHSIHKIGGEITSFKSYCGGIIAPESDDNLWHYKFTWNPKNIISAGADGAHYLLNNKIVHLNQKELFNNNKKIKVDSIGNLAFYPNRDSLKYLDLYEVPKIQTFLRATLRHPDFCKGWAAIIALGLNNENDQLPQGLNTYKDWFIFKTGYNNQGTISQFIAQKLHLGENDLVIKMLAELELWDAKKILNKKNNSADILLDLLLEKWAMKPEDKDLVVMQHEVVYGKKNKSHKHTSTLVLVGENQAHSAMAKTVGMPMALLAELMMLKKINFPIGVHLPNMPTIYNPILKALTKHQIDFIEENE